MAQYAANEIENMPDSPVAREDLGAGGNSRGSGSRSPLFWKVLLLSVAIVWGYSFTTMKDALDTIPVFELLYIRFLPAALVMLVIFRKRIAAHLNARNLIVGLLLLPETNILSTDTDAAHGLRIDNRHCLPSFPLFRS